MLTKKEFHGICTDHIDFLEDNKKQGLHRQAKEDFLNLKQAAASEGINIGVASGFRSFESQLNIWNEKVRGLRPVWDSHGNPIDIEEITATSLMFHILRWSALPGFSRHHWGSELDVYDLLASENPPQLIPREYEKSGPYAPLSAFLDEHMHRFHFYRPYAYDLGGVAREPWHLSYAPVSLACEKHLSIDSAYEFLSQRKKNILLGNLVLEGLEDIFKRFILNTSPP